MLSQGTPSLCKGITGHQKINHYITVIVYYFCKYILSNAAVNVNFTCDKLPNPSLSSRLRVYFLSALETPEPGSRKSETSVMR